MDIVEAQDEWRVPGQPLKNLSHRGVQAVPIPGSSIPCDGFAEHVPTERVRQVDLELRRPAGASHRAMLECPLSEMSE
jgi:hypothetical protein